MALALEQNLERVRARIERARRGAVREGRARLLAVTKSVEPDVALALARLGQHDLAENRHEGLAAKRALLDGAASDLPVRWHFVGHLQRNKARRVVLLADEIHSVDSVALAATLVRVAREERRRPRIYLQVKLSDETTKSGLDPRELRPALDAASEDDALELGGLMTMAPWIDDRAERSAAAGRTFAALAKLADEHRDAPWCEGRALLSMGMSDDFEEAVREGADWLRLGRALVAAAPDRSAVEG